MVWHFEGLVRGAESQLNARLDKQGSSIDRLASKVESILDSIPIQPREEKRKAETTTDIPIEETYQTNPTIVFDDDTPVEEGDEVESETVLSSMREMRVVRKWKRSRFYLSPYVNEPSKIGRWRKGKPTYHALRWLDKAKYSAMSKWLKDNDWVSTIKGGTTTLTKSFFINLLQKGGLLTNDVISLI